MTKKEIIPNTKFEMDSYISKIGMEISDYVYPRAST